MPALSYSHGASALPLLGETIGANLARTVAAFPDREALVDVPTRRRWTYPEFAAEVETLARALLAVGVQAGERVAIWAPNQPEWVFTQYATARVGAILVNINPAYRTSELAYVLRQSGTRVLVAAERFKTSDYRAMVEEVREQCPELATTVYLGTPDWADLLAQASRVDVGALAKREAQLSFDDPINIQYTSGTTGFPKGATLSHHNILNNGYFVAGTQRWTDADRVCVPVPFYHCFGMVMGNLGAATHGATVVIPARSFEPAATLRAVAQERCTALYGVPTMFIAELAEPDFASYDLSSLRTGVMAGSPCPVEVMKRVIAEMGMTEVTICYGMTETSPVSTQTRADDDLERRVSTVGAVHPHVEVKIVDPETGRVVPRGQPGELCTRGYMVMRGGENIYPREIEEFLYTHPDIEDAQVIGVPDSRYGEELMVWVRLREGAPALTAEALREFCSGRLAHYKIPRYVKVVDAFPMTITGKIRKVEMREISIADLNLEPPSPA